MPPPLPTSGPPPTKPSVETAGAEAEQVDKMIAPETTAKPKPDEVLLAEAEVAKATRAAETAAEEANAKLADLEAVEIKAQNEAAREAAELQAATNLDAGAEPGAVLETNPPQPMPAGLLAGARADELDVQQPVDIKPIQDLLNDFKVVQHDMRTAIMEAQQQAAAEKESRLSAWLPTWQTASDSQAARIGEMQDQMRQMRLMTELLQMKVNEGKLIEKEDVTVDEMRQQARRIGSWAFWAFDQALYRIAQLGTALYLKSRWDEYNLWYDLASKAGRSHEDAKRIAWKAAVPMFQGAADRELVQEIGGFTPEEIETMKSNGVKWETAYHKAQARSATRTTTGAGESSQSHGWFGGFYGSATPAPAAPPPGMA